MAGTKAIERPGEVGRLSMANRTDAEGDDDSPAKWTRVGEVDLVLKKDVDENDDVDEAKLLRPE